jgi:hypothetical protein
MTSQWRDNLKKSDRKQKKAAEEDAAIEEGRNRGGGERLGLGRE